MKTLKWFSLEWHISWQLIKLDSKELMGYMFFKTEQQAFDWLEANGYIERIKS